MTLTRSADVKVSVAALRKVLQKQLTEMQSVDERETTKAVAKRKTDLRDAITRGERYVKRAKEMLEAEGEDCLGELSAPPGFYGDRWRRTEAAAGVKKALKLLDLAASDELTLADATRLVGKHVIEAL